jgi:hypothetical protein
LSPLGEMVLLAVADGLALDEVVLELYEAISEL